MAQYEVEYNQKADEVEQVQEKMQAKEALVTDAEQRCLELKIELKRFKEKSQDLENELD